ncbi:MAG TPA: MlaD family protein, partial [Anaeromyxobacteraceae bacterium]|nr:MlaD family protein [Anaeromyxobacteraceae bacterium]
SDLVHGYFRDATGLTWKSRVQIAGIQVGEVSVISLEGDRARLDLRVKRGVVLHKNACLTKTYPSALLPDALLEAVPGRDPSPVLESLPEEEREITCIREATTVQQLTDALAAIASDVQAVTGDLRQTIGSQQGSLREIVENVSSITRSVEALMGERGGDLAEIVKNTRDFTADLSEMSEREKERVHAITVNVEEMTRELRDVAQSLQTIVDGRRPGARGAPGEEGKVAPEGAVAEEGGVREAVDRLNSSLGRMDELLAKVSEGKSPAGRLLTDEKMGREIAVAVEGLSSYVDNLVKMQLEVNLRSEWLLNQVGAKTYFGVRILPRADKWYMLEIVADPRGVDTVTTETVTTRDPTTGMETTTISTRSLHEDKLTFSAQIAKRYGPLTLRAGIIESSGGAGADLHLLEDRLTLSLSVYQFTRPYQDVFPRTKVWINWYFLQHLYLTAGADDFLNRWREGRYPGGPKFTIGNDVFFGGGIFFTDEDLKALIGSGAGSAASL